ncbi:MAG: hypothetical protein GXP29_00690, partial [Planctomycetes bacterium]|nr:hypothetical protein [Planctomycetota bacterium]
YSVAFKATAGLHHPVRHYNESVETRMHGFLNVFGGAILRAADAIDREGLLELLSDEQADAFAFAEDGFRWRSYVVSGDQVEKHRGKLAISYGSCSFDEPIEDLRAIGIFRD